LPRAERDRARAASSAADADVRAARAALAELRRGTREETIAQAESALAAAQATARAVSGDAERVRLSAPRAGVVDSLPFRVGDQLPAGTPLAVLLVGDLPYARVYVPQPLRTGIAVGSAARVFVQGSDAVHAGKVRSVRDEPTFTPYYALSGEDAERLSYLAEIELGPDAAALPAGVPVRAEFEPAR
jgi:HlyD family secretion protein